MRGIRKKILWLVVPFCLASCISKAEPGESFTLQSQPSASSVVRGPIKSIEELFENYVVIEPEFPSYDSFFYNGETSHNILSEDLYIYEDGQINYSSINEFRFFLFKLGNSFEIITVDNVVGYSLNVHCGSGINTGGTHILGLDEYSIIMLSLRTYESCRYQREYFIDIISRSETDGRINEIGTFVVFPDPDYPQVESLEGPVYVRWNGAYVSNYVFPQVNGQSQLVRYDDVMSVFEITHKENEGKYCKKNQ